MLRHGRWCHCYGCAFAEFCNVVAVPLLVLAGAVLILSQVMR